MNRNCQHYPETYPSPAVAVADCGPDTDDWTADVHAELRATEQAVAECCHPAIELGEPCDCMQVGGRPKQLRANPSCPACGGTGRPTVTTLVAGLDVLNREIDQLASAVGDICTPAKRFLDLAWWHTENAIRQLTEKCFMACKRGRFCACCHHYNELKPLAARMGRSL